MKFLKSFNEKYSLPNAVESLSKVINKFTLDKFNWWWMRNGLANYSEHHVLKISEINPDFPVSKVNLQLEFVVSEKFGLNRTGMSYTYFSTNKKMKPRIYKDGTTGIGISVKLYVPKDKKSYNEEELKDLIDDVITHELFHSFQAYKLESKGIKDVRGYDYKLSRILLHFIDLTFDFDFLGRLFNTAYVCASNEETLAHLSEIHTKEGAHWKKVFLEIYRKSFNQVLNKVKREIKVSDYMKIVDHFNELLDESFPGENHKKFETFEEIIKFLYDIIDKKKEFIFRRIARANYSKGEYSKLRNRKVK